MARIALLGASGRMGRTLIREISVAADLELVAAVDSRESAFIGQDAGSVAGIAALGVAVEALKPGFAETADLVIDFSGPEALAEFLKAGEQAKPLVSGTTGLGDEHERLLNAYAQQTPIVVSANFSSGITLLLELARTAAHVLGPDVEAEIVELHHHHKKDAPSGTAKMLARNVAEALELDDDAFCNGRSGMCGARPLREIGIHAVRGGEVVGEHTLHLFTGSERLELTHKAQGRECLALGALRAARWLLAPRANGRYDMRDVLNLGAKE